MVAHLPEESHFDDELVRSDLEPDPGERNGGFQELVEGDEDIEIAQG